VDYRDAVALAKRDFPHLDRHGLVDPAKLFRSQANLVRHPFDPDNEREIAAYKACENYLSTWIPMQRAYTKRGSYGIKHDVERMVDDCGAPHIHVPNGILILAAVTRGIAIVPDGSNINVRLRAKP
jgi:hypothetical protein